MKRILVITLLVVAMMFVGCSKEDTAGDAVRVSLDGGGGGGSTSSFFSKCVEVRGQPTCLQVQGTSPNECKTSSDCIVNTCYDSDGFDIYTRGNASGVNETGDYLAFDFCWGTTAWEQYCTNNERVTLKIPCEYGCENNVCVNEVHTCEDTDGGINYGLQGTVSGINGTSPFNMTDECRGFTGNNLVEYFCVNGYMGLTWEYCGFGCDDGACLTNSTGNNS